MSEFHFESENNDPIVFKKDEILKLMQELRIIIDEIGADEFCKRIENALNVHIKKYVPGRGSKYIR